MGACQYTDLCRLGVSDIASAGGIGHGPNCVTHGLNGITCRKIGLDGFACVKSGQRLRWSPHRHSGARLLLPCHHLPTSHTHFIVTWRQTTASLSGTSCDTGASSETTEPPRQERNNTLQSFMSTTCRIHASGSLGTQPFPSVAKHLLITVAYIDNPGSSDSKTALLIVLQISTALSTASRIQLHISLDAKSRNSLLNIKAYAMSYGKLTLVTSTGTVLHVRPMIAQKFLEFAMKGVRDTHPVPRSSERGTNGTLKL